MNEQNKFADQNHSGPPDDFCRVHNRLYWNECPECAEISSTKEGEEEKDPLYSHMENIKFMKAYYGHCKAYVECFPQDNGAFHIPYTNKWLTELNVKPGIDWQARRLKLEIMDWMRDSNISPESLETFRKWLFKK